MANKMSRCTLKIDYNLLRSFRAVADSGSISLASQSIHLSQPALSLQMKALEHQLGKKLFYRHRRGLSLTPFGELLNQKVDRFQEFEGEIAELISGDPGEPSGKIKIGTYTTASSYILAEPVSKFLKNHKKISVSYAYLPSDEMIQKIKDYHLDCGVFTDVPSDVLLERTELFKDRLIFAQSTKYPLCKKKIAPGELKNIDFLSYPLRFDLCYRKVEKYFGAHLSKTRIAAESESFDTLKQMLIAGAGATFIPQYLVKKELEQNILSEIEVGHHKIPIVFYLVTRKGADRSPAMKIFCESLTQNFQDE